MFSEREKFTGNKNRAGRKIPDRNGPEREAEGKAGKGVRDRNKPSAHFEISSVCTPKYTKKQTALYRLLSFLAI